MGIGDAKLSLWLVYRTQKMAFLFTVNWSEPPKEKESSDQNIEELLKLPRLLKKVLRKLPSFC